MICWIPFKTQNKRLHGVKNEKWCLPTTFQKKRLVALKNRFLSQNCGVCGGGSGVAAPSATKQPLHTNNGFVADSVVNSRRVGVCGRGRLIARLVSR